MRPNTLSKSDETRGRTMTRIARAVLSCALPVVLIGTAGCAHLNNPWADSSATVDADMTTPSTEGYSGQPEFPRSLRRTSPPADVTYANGAVTHWPLWFEDPFEDKGNRDQPPASGNESEPDNVFMVTWVDYLHMPYGPARLLPVNIAGWPASVVVTPPGTLMESDGVISKGLLGYDHDAQRADSVTRQPPDVDVLDRRPFTEEPPDESWEPSPDAAP